MIAAVGLSKWYGEVLALDDVSFDLGPGITGLLGQNGAGKSTLLRLLAGQLRPSRGEVRVDERSLESDRRLLGRIGYCPEPEGLPEELTGLELTCALTELHGIPAAEARERAVRVLDELDLGAAKERRIGEYSKGMRQRVKLAQALAHDPEVLLLDEPLNGCDPLARARVQEVLAARARRGACVLISSHVLPEVEALTSDIRLIHKGRLVAEGNVQELRALIDRHPHQVRIECARPRALAEALVRAPHVLSLEIEAAALVVQTREPDALYPMIPEAARAAGILITSLTSPDDNLAAVFRYLTEERAEERASA